MSVVSFISYLALRGKNESKQCRVRGGEVVNNNQKKHETAEMSE